MSDDLLPVERKVLEVLGDVHGLWVLWVWGEMESREFAQAVGVSRPTATGVVTTLKGCGFVRRRKDARDGRMVLVSLTATGKRKIEG